MLRRSFYLTFFLISSTVFSFSGINSKDLPNFSSLAEYTSPSVVNVSVVKTVPSRDRMQGSRSPFPPGSPFEDFFNFPFEDRNQPERKIQSGGSGFIISSDGYVLTNHHVIEDASEITISLNDRREFKAKLIGSDKKADVAVLKIDSDKELPFLKLGNSDEVKVGDWVVAIGSPYRLNFSVTAGIVSAKTRSVPGRETSYIPFIQSDVAINPGNSGGPLFDLNGRVVGINSQIYSRSGGYQGLAFAIPIDVAMEVASQIINDGSVARGYLGVRVGEVDNDLAEALSMEKPYGALITDVEKGESGDDAGLQAGDVIIEFNGKEIKFGSDLPHVVGRIQPKTKANAKIIRDGKNVNLKFTLGELPADERTFIPAKTEISSDPLGLKIEDLSEENSRPNDPESGVFVLRVNNGSPAYGKLTRGDIITEVISQGKRHTIEDAESFEDLVEEFEEGDKLAIVGRRNNNRFFVAVTVD